jgi:hypothetical protein
VATRLATGVVAFWPRSARLRPHPERSSPGRSNAAAVRAWRRFRRYNICGYTDIWSSNSSSARSATRLASAAQAGAHSPPYRGRRYHLRHGCCRRHAPVSATSPDFARLAAGDLKKNEHAQWLKANSKRP